MKKIPFNKTYLIGKELKYIEESVKGGKISGNGVFTKKCQNFFEKRYGFKKTLLTTSCTDALEMAAILINITPGDEVILPSFTFVSTANAFALRGAKLIFADSRKDHPGIDESKLESLITTRTKAIVVVHYAGVAVDMNKIMSLAKTYNLFVVEDAAQAIDSYYIHDNKKTPLGKIGHLSAFSFHETKNIISGEGGMLVINDDRFLDRSEIIWEKGTNRTAFFKGEIDKYGWVDIGSSFLPSDVIAAFLYAQLEHLQLIQEKRKQLWEFYFEELSIIEKRGLVVLPKIPTFATNNAHMFYLVCSGLDDRTKLIEHLKRKGILAVFHYQSLHKSDFYLKNNREVHLPNADHYTDSLIRLPLFYDLQLNEAKHIADSIKEFYGIEP